MFNRLMPAGPIFRYAFESTAISSVGSWDLWCITAPTNSRLAIREVRLGQFTEFGDAQAELLPIQFLIGSTAIAGGAGLTGRNVRAYSGAATAASSVTGPSTTLASTTSAYASMQDSFNVAAGFYWRPPEDERDIIGLGQRFVVRIGPANDVLSLRGTLTLQELGQTPQ